MIEVVPVVVAAVARRRFGREKTVEGGEMRERHVGLGMRMRERERVRCGEKEDMKLR